MWLIREFEAMKSSQARDLGTKLVSNTYMDRTEVKYASHYIRSHSI